jgi:hypothetical protein
MCALAMIFPENASTGLFVRIVCDEFHESRSVKIVDLD